MTYWFAGVLVVIMLVVQIGIAAGRRDGKGLARAGIGLAQFLIVTAAWIGYTVAVTAAMGGLTRATMQSLLNVTSWNSWQPWTSFDAKQVTDAGLATVLGLLGLFMWIAAIGHLLVILARDAALDGAGRNRPDRRGRAGERNHPRLVLEGVPLVPRRGRLTAAGGDRDRGRDEVRRRGRRGQGGLDRSLGGHGRCRRSC